ncbi:MAG: serine/threonine protein kinase [Microthrixaceae bacterium]|nr:serine/threonine protein kinase [Microthrixaceae bacterium]
MSAERDKSIEGTASHSTRNQGDPAGIIEAQLAHLFDRVRVIADGRNAIVVAATQRSTGRQVAVKVIRSHIWIGGPSASAEVTAHAEMSWHPNVATLLDAGVTSGGLLWLCMEYAPTTLGARLERRSVEAPELLGIAQQLAAATAAIHARRIVHCDLKPSNVLLALDGGVRVSDFGIAELLHLTPPTLDSVRGSLHYMSPEVLEGSRPTAASDIWGIGATLWAAAHGRPPFGDGAEALGSAMQAALIGLPDWNPMWNGNSPEAERLKEIVGLCTIPDPAGRPTAAELAGLLARPLSVPPSPIYIAQRPEPSRPSRMWAVAALVGTLVLAGAAVAVRDRGSSQVRFTNVTAREWCEAVGRSDTKIGNALDAAATTLVAGGRTATAMRAALRELPRQVASATSQWRRWLALEPEFAGEAAALSDSNLRDFIVAETATYLATGQFIGSNSTSSEDLIRNGLPRDIATTADALGRVAERSRIACGSEGGSWRDAQIRLADEVRVSLEGPNSPFFSDPAAATALDADLLATVLTVQPGYFVRLVTANPGWLIAATARDTGSPAITSMLLNEGAKAFQEIAIGSREVAAYLYQDNQLLQMDLADTLPRSDVSGFLRQIRELSERQ